MSDTTLLQERKSASKVIFSGRVSRSQSVPLLPTPDVVTLYTTPIDGAPPFLFLCLYVIRDSLSLACRVGLTTMMFVMDLLLRLFLFATEMWLHIPGMFVLTTAIRFSMWCFQIILWVTYTAVELMFYLPGPLLIIYFLIIGAAYYTMPEAVEALLHSVWWMLEHLFKIVGYLAYPSNKTP